MAVAIIIQSIITLLITCLRIIWRWRLSTDSYCRCTATTEVITVGIPIAIIIDTIIADRIGVLFISRTTATDRDKRILATSKIIAIYKIIIIIIQTIRTKLITVFPSTRTDSNIWIVSAIVIIAIDEAITIIVLPITALIISSFSGRRMGRITTDSHGRSTATTKIIAISITITIVIYSIVTNSVSVFSIATTTDSHIRIATTSEVITVSITIAIIVDSVVANSIGILLNRRSTATVSGGRAGGIITICLTVVVIITTV